MKTRTVAIPVVGLLVSFAQSPPTYSFDVVEAGTEHYRVAIVQDEPGRFAGMYSCWAGPAHPASLAAGRDAPMMNYSTDRTGLVPHQNYTFVRSYGSGVDYRLGSSWEALSQYPYSADPGFECVDVNLTSLPIVDSILESGEAIGLRASWNLMAGEDDLLAELTLRVHGEDALDGAVEVSLRVVNRSPEPARVGIRHWWPLVMRGAVGGSTLVPTWFVGSRPPDPPDSPYPTTETEWEPPEFRMWELAPQGPVAVRLPDPYAIAAAIAGPPSLDPVPTPPDLLQHARLNTNGEDDHTGGGSGDRCFLWRVPDPPRAVRPSGRQGMTSYWGPDEDRAIWLDPGGEVTVTQYLMAYVQYPVTPSAGGPYEAACIGGAASAVLDGRRSLLDALTAGEVLHRWSSPDPRVTFEDTADPATVVHAEGAGRFPLHYTITQGPYEATSTTHFEVLDLEPPRITRLEASPRSLWPPNHRFQDVNVTIEAEDDCDAAPQVRLVSVESNQLERWLPGAGAGHTDLDVEGAEIGTDDRHLRLRAERSGPLSTGRSYRLTYEVSDASGNVTQESVEVHVARDRRRRR